MRVLTRLVDVQDQGAVVKIVQQAVKYSYVSVLEALADLRLDLPPPEKYWLVMIDLKHGHVIRHLLTQLFWFFPAEYRQFQIMQQPGLLLNAVGKRMGGAVISELLKHTMVESRDEYLEALLIHGAWHEVANQPNPIVTAVVDSGHRLQGCARGSYIQAWLLGELTGDTEFEMY